MLSLARHYAYPLAACPVDGREALLLPTVKIPIAAPTNGPGQQHLRISLLDSNRRLLASWQPPGSPQRGSRTQHATLPDNLEGQLQSGPGSEDAAGATAAGGLVFQQHVRESAGGLQEQLGSEQAMHLEVQELWAAVPRPGTFFVKVGERHWQCSIQLARKQCSCAFGSLLCGL